MKYFFTLLFFLVGVFCLAEDPANYQGGGFSKTRQVFEHQTSSVYDVDTTTMTITIPSQNAGVLSSITIQNDDETGSIFVDGARGYAYNVSATNGTTTAGSNTLTFGAPILGLKVGDLIVLDEAVDDANDGIYCIHEINSTNNIVTLDRNLTLSKVSTQDFKIRSTEIKAGEKGSFSVGSRLITLFASENDTTMRLTLTYQKKN